MRNFNWRERKIYLINVKIKDTVRGWAAIVGEKIWNIGFRKEIDKSLPTKNYCFQIKTNKN